MKKIVFGILVLLAAFGCSKNTPKEVTINGAGATFPYPLYSQWSYKYNRLASLKLNYQSIGSGGGIAQIKAKTVNFGASDAPLKAEELDQAGLIQFPMIIGGVVPVINVQGIASGAINLTPEILAGIYLGKITKWNDPAMKSANPQANLPSSDITVVHRADGSGTTWIFTSYLAAVSPEWKSKVGGGKSVEWPIGVGGKGNEGVAAYVQRVSGSIGYVEYAYALQNKMTYTKLTNHDGAVVEPTIATFQAAAANADWVNAPGYYMELIDQPGVDSWPITGASFILLYKDQADAAKGKAMLAFFDWCYKHGAEMARSLDYVPIPENVVQLVETSWTKEVRSGGQPIWP